MKALISPEHDEVTLILPTEPQMAEEITVPLYGVGVVSGLNTNYQDSGQSYLMVKFNKDGKETQFPYVLAK